ncbi:MAG: hypothetical protein ACI91B_004097 [Planctomycetota bacterium]|jgi:hypothetical protein
MKARNTEAKTTLLQGIRAASRATIETTLRDCLRPPRCRFADTEFHAKQAPNIGSE